MFNGCYVQLPKNLNAVEALNGSQVKACNAKEVTGCISISLCCSDMHYFHAYSSEIVAQNDHVPCKNTLWCIDSRTDLYGVTL